MRRIVFSLEDCFVTLPDPSNPFGVPTSTDVAVVDPPVAPESAAEPSPALVTMTREDLQALLDSAIQRAVAAVVVNVPGVAAPAPPAKPEIFDLNWLLKMLVAGSSAGTFHSEHLFR